MIHNLADLEPILGQYDPGKVLVGPLLNLWTNSSFRVFNIAGNGGKIICETIGLGFVERETDAQRRRAVIVAALQSRFGEVQIFDSQLEMAQAAHTLWANDETSRFLATATAESKLRPTAEVDQDQSLDDASNSSVLPSDRDKEFVDEAARGSVAPDAASAHAPLSAPDQAQPTPACHPAQTDEPLDLPKVHARLPLDCDSPTFAVVGLKSSTDGIATTETIAATDAHTETAAATDANTETAAETDADSQTIAETDANTFRARSAKPKRRPRRARRGSGAGADGAAPVAAVANTKTITETAANAQPVVEHSDQMPVEKQSQSEPASSDHALRQRALRTDLVLFTPPAGDLKWPLWGRIITLCMLTLGIASVIVLLINYEESIRDNVPSPPASVYSRGGSPSEKLTGVGSAPVDSKSMLTSQPGAADGEADAAPFPRAQPSQNPSVQAEAAPDEQLSQSPKAQGNQADALPEAATPKAPEALSTGALQRQASNSAIVPLPRPRTVVNAVPSDRPRRRIAPLGEGALSPDHNCCRAPVRQKLESALPLVAVVSTEAQSQQRRTVSSPLFSLFGH